MDQENKELIADLKEAHQSCVQRLSSLSNNGSLPSGTVQNAVGEVQRLFDDFQAKELWVHPFSYPSAELADLILDLKIAPEGDPQAYLDRTLRLVEFLREEVLSRARTWAAAANISDWNMKMLDELLRIRRYIRDCKNRLREQGFDIDQDADLISLEEQFAEKLAEYRALLRENAVQTNEFHLDLMQQIGHLIRNAEEPQFLKRGYRRLIDCIVLFVADANA